ncbi:MAG: hypothetical protein JOZ58_02345, partial [Acetobacteraceae bacterium]|nr:hypothetical protein [Acetobacteraceae bacterium]
LFLLLVALFFMNLRRPDPLLRLAGSAGLLWLFFMFTLTFADVLTRQLITQRHHYAPLARDPHAADGSSRVLTAPPGLDPVGRHRHGAPRNSPREVNS